MKIGLCLSIFLCAATFVLQAAPADYEKVDRAVFTATTGKWGDAQNWSTKTLPAGSVSPLIPFGNAATLDCPVSVTSAIYPGNKPAGAATLSIVDGGQYEGGAQSIPLIIAKEFDGIPPAAEIVNFPPRACLRADVATEGKATLVLK